MIAFIAHRSTSHSGAVLLRSTPVWIRWSVPTFSFSATTRVESDDVKKQQRDLLRKRLLALPKLSLSPPKPSLNAYALFFKDSYRTAAANDDGEPTSKRGVRLVKKVAEMWHALGEEEKKKYQIQAESAKSTYETAHQAYLSKRPLKDILILSRKFSLEKRLNIRAARRAHSDPNAPKKPLNAFFLYVKDMKEDSGIKNGKELIKDLSKKWRDLDLAEREPYIVKANALLSDYKTKLSAYEAATGLCDLKKSIEQEIKAPERAAAAARAAKAKRENDLRSVKKLKEKEKVKQRIQAKRKAAEIARKKAAATDAKKKKKTKKVNKKVQ